MEESGNDLMQHLHKNPSLSLQQKNSLHFEGPQMNGPYRHYPGAGGGLSLEAAAAAAKRPPGFPPASPYSHFPPPPPSSAGSPGAGPYHSRSLSQPAFFALDSLPPLGPTGPSPTTSPSDSAASADVSMEDGGGAAHDASATSRSPPLLPRPGAGGCRPPPAAGDGLPTRKAHRRSQSDIPFGFFNSSPPPLATAPLPPLHRGPAPPQLVKLEADWGRNLDAAAADVAGERRLEGDPGDDLFNAYMNLEGLDTLNSSEEKRDDLDSRASGSKNGAESSENEAESSMNEGSGAGMRLWGNLNVSMEKKEVGKQGAAGDYGQHTRHCRSLSMDSFMGKLNFGEESPKLPPSPGPRPGHSKSNSMDGTTNTFSLEFGNAEFSPAELKKIMANEKLAEMAMTDPKRVKRILANRQSAARSKERKMRYIAELEHKVQTLQTEATTLSAQVTLLQRDSAGLTSQNNELKFRLQAMEQQAQLRDALNEALTAEVQRLKLATAELGDAHPANSQFSINSQLFQLQLQQQQSSQISLYQLQQQQQDNANTNHESKK